MSKKQLCQFCLVGETQFIKVILFLAFGLNRQSGGDGQGMCGKKAEEWCAAKALAETGDWAAKGNVSPNFWNLRPLSSCKDSCSFRLHRNMSVIIY